MTSLKDSANITFFNKETGEEVMNIPIKNHTNIKSKDNIPYNNLIPFKMQFDDCMEIQIFITKETYGIMMDYKNRVQK